MVLLACSVLPLTADSRATWHFSVIARSRQFSIIAHANVKVLSAVCTIEFLDASLKVVGRQSLVMDKIPIDAGQQRVQTGAFIEGAVDARGVTMQWTVVAAPLWWELSLQATPLRRFLARQILIDFDLQAEFDAA